jgi:hypothetical protein
MVNQPSGTDSSVCLPTPHHTNRAIATSRQSATSVSRTGQTPILPASSLLLRRFTCNLNRRKKWPEQTESRDLSSCIARQQELSSKPNRRSPVRSRGGIWSWAYRSFCGHCFVLFLSAFMCTKAPR